jgi:threonine dehydratase
MSTTLDQAAIRACERVIRPYLRHTPVVTVAGDDFGLDCESITFKLELLQHSGSFKCRGAFANLLMRDVPEAGVVAASGGNHGAAVAFAARQLGVPAKIFVPRISSPAKLARIEQYGADLVVEGERYADALAASKAWLHDSGAMEVHAFDQFETLLGQGTLGLEFDQDAPGVESVLAAVGGGGLIGGIAAWYANRVKVVGVEPAAAPTLHEALQAGRPVDAPAGGLAADSLAPKQVGQQMFPVAQRYVSEVALVDDDAIRDAQRTLWNVLRIVAEPGGATAFAALLSGAYRPAANERVGVVISGGNTAVVDFDD